MVEYKHCAKCENRINKKEDICPFCSNPVSEKGQNESQEIWGIKNSNKTKEQIVKDNVPKFFNKEEIKKIIIGVSVFFVLYFIYTSFFVLYFIYTSVFPSYNDKDIQNSNAITQLSYMNKLIKFDKRYNSYSNDIVKSGIYNEMINFVEDNKIIKDWKGSVKLRTNKGGSNITVYITSKYKGFEVEFMDELSADSPLVYHLRTIGSLGWVAFSGKITNTDRSITESGQMYNPEFGIYLTSVSKENKKNVRVVEYEENKENYKNYGFLVLENPRFVHKDKWIKIGTNIGRTTKKMKLDIATIAYRKYKCEIGGDTEIKIYDIRVRNGKIIKKSSMARVWYSFDKNGSSELNYDDSCKDIDGVKIIGKDWIWW